MGVTTNWQTHHIHYIYIYICKYHVWSNLLVVNNGGLVKGYLDPSQRLQMDRLLAKARERERESGKKTEIGSTLRLRKLVTPIAQADERAAKGNLGKRGLPRSCFHCCHWQPDMPSASAEVTWLVECLYQNARRAAAR